MDANAPLVGANAALPGASVPYVTEEGGCGLQAPSVTPAIHPPLAYPPICLSSSCTARSN
jgi:hypothetical protein